MKSMTRTRLLLNIITIFLYVSGIPLAFFLFLCLRENHFVFQQIVTAGSFPILCVLLVLWIVLLFFSFVLKILIKDIDEELRMLSDKYEEKKTEEISNIEVIAKRVEERKR